MTASLKIRSAERNDIQNIANVIVPIQQQEFEIPISYEQQPDLLDIRTFYQSGNGGFWVAQAGNEIVGTIGLKDIGNNKAALRKMFVRADYRGEPHRFYEKNGFEEINPDTLPASFPRMTIDTKFYKFEI